MKKNYILILLTILVFGCSKSDDKENEKLIRLKNCYVDYLFFDDDIRFAYGTPMFSTIGYNRNLLSLKYNENRACQISGGYWPPCSFNDHTYPVYNSKVFDLLTTKETENSIYVNPSNYESSDTTNQTFIYTLDRYNRLIKISRPNGNTLFYTYLKDQIVEKDTSGSITRNFYFENNNLIRITKIIGDSSSGNYLVHEIKFNSFDKNPNPFKNLFHIQGAFFRSFSENNYLDCFINCYEVKNGISQGLISRTWRSVDFSYNSQGYPTYGEYEEY